AMERCDNIVAAPTGHLVVCEDGGGDNFLRALSPDGRIAPLARTSLSELCGACFSPDGTTLFVNIQVPGITLAITGPWAQMT
ncbi:MAG: alkaline phosphatase PhoX, partial [Pseudomonadota bacterium]